MLSKVSICIKLKLTALSLKTHCFFTIAAVNLTTSMPNVTMKLTSSTVATQEIRALLHRPQEREPNNLDAVIIACVAAVLIISLALVLALLIRRRMAKKRVEQL